MFSSVLTGTASGLSVTAVAICMAASLVSGMILSLTYRKCENATKSFLLTIALMPLIVQLIILMVNGNLGVGVAVAGSFSLVKFRSLPGKASDILIVFASMCLGLATGMGYAVLAVAASVVIAILYAVLAMTPVLNSDASYRSLRITVPEDLDYIEVFDDIFSTYTVKAEEQAVRTINLGTMYQVTYDIRLKDQSKEKELLDAIRVRNGNLPVISSRAATVAAEL